MSSEKFMDLPSGWHKAQIIFNIVGAIAIPVLIAIFTIVYSNAVKKREVGVHYVELAINILREEPKPKTQALRKWAVGVLDKYSDVPLSDDARRTLMEEKLDVSVSVPDAGVSALGENPQASGK